MKKQRARICKQEKNSQHICNINNIILRGGGNKKAVSLMISYVLLIAIVIGLAIGVYAWLRVIANISPTPDCKEGTSIILEQENCYPGSLELDLKNNGRFNISGVIVAISNETQQQPTIYLIPDKQGGVIKGNYYFPTPLSPQEITTVLFTNKDENGDTIIDVTAIQLQPFIIDKNQKVVCKEAVITQELTGCQIG